MVGISPALWNRVGITPPQGDYSNRLATTAFARLPPFGPGVPSTTSYTIQPNDHLKVISSGDAGGTLTITVPDTTPTGLIFWAFRNANNIIVEVSGGDIAWPTGQFTSSFTIGPNYQIVGFTYDGTNLYVLSNSPGTPTVTGLTSGSSATYDVPAGVTYLHVRMYGGGGGGGGTGTSATGGGTGGETIFGSWTANGGAGGADSASTGAGAGGTGGTGGSNGTGTAIVRVQGNDGSPGAGANATTSAIPSGGSGGGGVYGGAGKGGPNAGGTGSAGFGNSGAGGGGAGGTNAATQYGAAGGGGAGEYVEFFWYNPGSSVTYTVGAAGSAGTGGTGDGGAGGSGNITVIEHYD